MLYIYGGKIYIKPLENRLVEVNITKRGNEYNVEPTERKVELNDKIRNDLFSITLERAYEIQNGVKTSKKFDLE